MVTSYIIYISFNDNFVAGKTFIIITFVFKFVVNKINGKSETRLLKYPKFMSKWKKNNENIMIKYNFLLSKTSLLIV